MTEIARDRMTKIARIGSFPVMAERAEVIAEMLLARARDRISTWIVTLNWETISRGLMRRQYQELLHGADLFSADGMPLVYLSKMSDTPIPGRTTGVGLVHQLLDQAQHLKVAVIGGNDRERICEFLTAKGLQSPFAWTDKYLGTHEQNKDIHDMLIARGIALVFVGLGSPKQELLCAYLKERAFPGVCIGVGGAFDMLMGTLPRAPLWMQNSGLEWLFRLTREPGRLWRRYLLIYPLGGVLYLASSLRGLLTCKRL